MQLRMCSLILKSDPNISSIYSHACGIEDNVENHLIVTGGKDGSSYLNKVTKYNVNGSYEVLPTLNVAREGHACGCYLNTNEEKV